MSLNTVWPNFFGKFSTSCETGTKEVLPSAECLVSFFKRCTSSMVLMQYWRGIEFQNWFSRPWKSIEFGQNVL